MERERERVARKDELSGLIEKKRQKKNIASVSEKGDAVRGGKRNVIEW